MRVLDLFSGIGGFALGLQRADMQIVAFCESDPFCREVLSKHWPQVPIHDDVRTLRTAGIAADVICGGFPCQDISVAGKGAGIDGERSGLWSEYARIIGEVRPRYVIVENVAVLLGRGLGRVLGDLAALGYDAEWRCIRACDLGAPHIRDRIWIVAYPTIKRCDGGAAQGGLEARSGTRIEAASSNGPVAYPERDELRHEPGRRHGARGAGAAEPGDNGEAQSAADAGLQRLPFGPRIFTWRQISDAPAPAHDWRLTQSPVCRADARLPHRVDRLKALGNSLVPQIAELIGRAIMQREADHANV